ncbi:hypothetical protein EYZ11_008569 [Aspergillus tanneri]|uniref:Uncharacterized protein n=1 Tax=Aspergillus tanneri TaxID=1220188 RepID=A0A4S3JA34_9EURO|nr:hypothetical protein EYZ11_008569 [Aspergillus tanneri]
MRSIRLMLVPGLLCSEYGEDTLNAIADDAYALATHGSQAMSDFQNTDAATHDAVKRLVDTMFFRPSDDEFETVRTRVDGVRSWMETGGNVNNGQNKKTYLFCGDSWAIRKDMKSQMKDKDGNNIVFKSSGKPIRIKDSKTMNKAREDLAKKIGTKETSNLGVSPSIGVML